MNFDIDAFSHSQVYSKIWLCEELERVCWIPNPTIFVLGGWQGILSFILLSRRNIDIKHIRSFDIDPTCELIADSINNAWVYDDWKFKAFTKDANQIDYSDRPDIVINTSTEHFDKLSWFNNIPERTLVCLQGNDLNHDDHKSEYKDFKDFKSKFSFSSILFEGEKKFKYPEINFSRYMIIGIK